MSGISPDELTQTKVSIRGRDEPMNVFAADDATVLAGLVDPQEASPIMDAQVA